MALNGDTYFKYPAVSNSDLSTLKKLIYGGNEFDPTEAYKFGTLIDMMLTEPDKVNYLTYQCNGEQYTVEDFEKAKQMKRSFFKDDLAKRMLENAETQRIFHKHVYINDGIKYGFDMKCKFDIWMPKLNWGGDIKSTTATSQKQFEAAARHFDYDRQRFVYMTLAGSNQDILIAVSKVNFQVFKIPIKRGDEFFNSGQQKYKELAFQYWNLIA